MKFVPSIKVFQGKKNLVFNFGGSQQFENNQFSWSVFTS